MSSGVTPASLIVFGIALFTASDKAPCCTLFAVVVAVETLLGSSKSFMRSGVTPASSTVVGITVEAAEMTVALEVASAAYFWELAALFRLLRYLIRQNHNIPRVQL